MRERPLLYLVPPAAAALYAAVCLEMPVSLRVVLPMLAVLLFGVLVSRGRSKRLLALFAVFAAACAALTGFAVYRSQVVEPVRALADDEPREITATVLQDSEVYDDSQRALLAVEPEGARTFRTRCYLPLTEQPLQAGDRLRAVVRFRVPGTTEGFDRAAYQASNGCYVTASCVLDDENEPEVFVLLDSRRDSLRFLPQRIARFCRQAVQDALPECEAGLLSGLLVGGTKRMSEDDLTAFRIAGLSHLTAVSGLHIGFLVGFCTLLLGKRWGTYVSVPLVLLFVPIAGATPSVLRAALMYLAAAGGFAARKRANSLDALLAALAILLAVNPYAIASVGLQLSFASTLGLSLFSMKMQHAMARPFAGAPAPVRKLIAAVSGALSCTVCASICTAPILLTSFGAVSVLSPISNLLTVGVTSLCFVGGLLLCLASAVCPALVPLLARVVRPMLTYILWAANTVADLGFGTLHPDNTFGLAALGLVFAALVVWMTIGKHIRWRYVLPGAAVVLTGLCIAEVQLQNSRYSVTYLPCGAGQAVLLSDTERAVLIDCAGSGNYHNAARQVREWMRWNGIRRLDTVVLTAVDRGHTRDLPELMQTVEVGTLLMPANCQERQTNADLLAFVQENGAQEVAEAYTLDTGIAPMALFPVTDGKLGVCIDGQALILHSPTAKQLAAYMEENTLPAAAELVFSANHLEEDAVLREAAEAAGAQQIMLATGSEKGLRSYKGLDVQSTYLAGEITRQFKKE